MKIYKYILLGVFCYLAAHLAVWPFNNEKSITVHAKSSGDNSQEAQLCQMRYEELAFITKIDDRHLESTPLETTNDNRLEKAQVSAYNSVSWQTDSSPCISADGTNICNYRGCIVASNQYPLGTKIDLEGVGECDVKDRMNPRYQEGYMDLYMGMDVQKALQFGRRELHYMVIE